MRVILASIFVILPVVLLSQDFMFNFENDVLTGSDDDYTNGIELGYRPDGSRYMYGIKQLMYTPPNIKNPVQAPNDRPWAGVLTLFIDSYKSEGPKATKARIEIGVLGPAAGAKHAQRVIHTLTDSSRPRGWSNQLKNEPVIQSTYDIKYRVISLGSDYNFSIDTLHGAELGTLFASANSGAEALLGYNVPRVRPSPGIVAKAVKDYSLYLRLGCLGYYRPHNATIGRSIFRDREDYRHSIKPIIGQVWYGVSAGYRNLSLDYTVNYRSKEFRGQHKSVDWGMISLNYINKF